MFATFTSDLVYGGGFEARAVHAVSLLVVFLTMIQVVLMFCLASTLLPVGVFLVCVRGCISDIQDMVDVVAAVTTSPGSISSL